MNVKVVVEVIVQMRSSKTAIEQKKRNNGNSKTYGGATGNRCSFF
jgi:hypothetical protein